MSKLKAQMYLPWARVFIFIMLSTITQQCLKKPNPLIIGHRGAMGHELENTIASVNKALDLGVDMIEIDVFKIASGEIV
ncbi:glycerophosphodiester phosphodiesterase, partial [Arthrospira platensis SPKY1]|nr:glycerophosphodiester phosphodiesterase [Arthrospira platensis SPKY1]